ncbi:hypothetical protein CORC01_07674 [Colletotrichum orchidophilum]|uniref:Uncharacterized protein n=1 Tax=Colletotrichum orchidophilum TaxID=1209926 RepID=A0A1G4B720_9PEZI|nr:uncharacterized protein CORC01_07674 [Colletotrichum orchidophilum]OHE97065.1 hypothetical protein CORC01_07674 [Colletotrichum orchidophilum]
MPWLLWSLIFPPRPDLSADACGCCAPILQYSRLRVLVFCLKLLGLMSRLVGWIGLYSGRNKTTGSSIASPFAFASRPISTSASHDLVVKCLFFLHGSLGRRPLPCVVGDESRTVNC